ncbi:MAG TPA: hypothetical protein DHV62_08260 [Elusimicrobia bacterium]|jgi:rubrerythrin|nr:hypothetical protein [Elusimicrobiota bacterium]
MEKAELRNLLRVFKFAANGERKAQKMYLKAKERFSKHEDCAKLFEWLYNEEAEHEEKLREKYISLKEEKGL